MAHRPVHRRRARRATSGVLGVFVVVRRASERAGDAGPCRDRPGDSRPSHWLRPSRQQCPRRRPRECRDAGSLVAVAAGVAFERLSAHPHLHPSPGLRADPLRPGIPDVHTGEQPCCSPASGRGRSRYGGQRPQQRRRDGVRRDSNGRAARRRRSGRRDPVPEPRPPPRPRAPCTTTPRRSPRGRTCPCPRLLSGTIPDFDAAPVAGTYPRNLFSMSRARAAMLVVSETVTSLCPAEPATAGSPTFDLPHSPRTSAIDLPPQPAPAGRQRPVAPRHHNSWAGLRRRRRADDSPIGRGGQGAGRGRPGRRYEDLPRLRAPPGRPDRLVPAPARSAPSRCDPPRRRARLSLGPHPSTRPRRRLGVLGTRTGRSSISPECGTWSSSRTSTAASARSLDRLESEGMADDTMIVVASDHGIAFESDEHRRAVPTQRQ